MRVVITCGGTGGHIIPAIAIADIVKDRWNEAEILFIGATGGMERTLVERAGYDIRTLRVEGLSRKMTPANFKSAWLAVRAVSHALHILDDFSPDIVIGTGGYACYPALRAAIRRGIPTVAHESNATAGLAIRQLSGRLSRVWLNFDAARETLDPRAKVLTVGNPLPRDYAQPAPIALPTGKRRMLLSFGGSLGADAINDAILELMEREKKPDDIYHVHATGARSYDAFCARMREKRLLGRSQFKVVPFLSPMASYMAAADVVICRAGAMSISELAALARPAILIPSPNVTGNHQYKNAKALADKGAALLLEEQQLSEQALCNAVFSLLSDARARVAMSQAIKTFHHPGANREIVADICKICDK